jgi:hypothetical protein
MKRIAGIATFVALALLAYVSANLEWHFGASHGPIALFPQYDEPLVSNGVDGGRPPAEHVRD